LLAYFIGHLHYTRPGQAKKRFDQFGRNAPNYAGCFKAIIEISMVSAERIFKIIIALIAFYLFFFSFVYKIKSSFLPWNENALLLCQALRQAVF
jgi:hypothetical protein